jgi:serine/threonine protein kinase
LGSSKPILAEPRRRRGSLAPDGGEEKGEPPGALSLLIQELANAPGETLLSAWSKELREGDQVGRFRILGELGRGGFGVVYEAEDTELGRHVALKALRPRRTGNELSADWIRKEAEAVARLDHPCIVTLHDVGTSDGSPYLVMELLRGETLAQRLAKGPLELDEALRVGSQMARGLAHAHARGILHRDLKPANVFLCEDGRVKLLDFGLAHLLGSTDASGSGTPAYMAPEQARGEEIDARADVYSAALTLRESVTGRRDAGPGAGAVVPAVLARVLDLAISPDPEARPRDGTAWLDAIGSVQSALDRPRRLRRVAALVGAGLAVGAAVVWLVAVRGGRGHLAGPDGRIAVAVADFSNQTGDTDLDGLSGMLVTSLEQSPKLRVLTRGRMVDALRSMGRETSSRIDEPLAREVGKIVGARALLLASIRRLDDLYAVEMRVVDPERDEYLFTVREEATGKKAVLALIDRLSERTRTALREEPSAVAASSAPVARTTTGNLEAYEHYFRGQQFSDTYQSEKALAEFQAAIALDPGFALAHLAAAQESDWSGASLEEQRARLEPAVALAERAGEKERVLIQAWKAHLDGDDAETKRLYDLAIERWPDDKRILFDAGDLRFHRADAGVTEEYAAALPYFERVLRLDPAYEPAFQHQLWCLEQLGRPEEALVRARAWDALVGGPRGAKWVMTTSWMNRRWGEAAEAGRRWVGLDPRPAPRLQVATSLISGGDLPGAEAVVEPMVRGPVHPDSPAPPAAIVTSAAVLAGQGRRAEAVPVLDRLEARPRARFTVLRLLGDGKPEAAREALAAFVRVASSSGRPVAPETAWEQATAALLLGDRPRAEELARSLRPGRTGERAYRGIRAWKDGQLDEAATMLRPIAFPPVDDVWGQDVRPLARLALAEVEVARGDPEAALTALELLRLHPSPTAGYLTWTWVNPYGRLLEARTLDAVGRRVEARERVAALLDTLKGADEGYWLAAEARALQASLAAAR